MIKPDTRTIDYRDYTELEPDLPPASSYVGVTSSGVEYCKVEAGDAKQGPTIVIPSAFQEMVGDPIT